MYLILAAYLVLLTIHFNISPLKLPRWPFPGFGLVSFYGFTGTLWWFHFIALPGALTIALLPIALRLNGLSNSPLRVWGALAAIGIPLLCTLWPALGFDRPVIWGPATLHAGGSAFLLTLSLPKILLVLAVFSVKSPRALIYFQRPGFIAALLLALALLLLAVALDIPRAVKWGLFLPWFLVVNLTVTVLGEELFFRVLLQDNLRRWLSRWRGARWIAALITGALFYIAHGFALPANNVAWMYLAASCSYALFYLLYRNLFASIALHFFVNVFHVILFRYPLI